MKLDTPPKQSFGLGYIPGAKDFRDILFKHPSKHYSSRPLNAIKYIAVHHSLTKTGSAESFARYHVKHNGWPGIGYHFVIERSGIIKWCHNLEVKSYHIGNSNRVSVGICLVGDFREQQLEVIQLDPLIRLLKFLIRELGIAPENIWGHNQFPGYVWKQCPCIDMSIIRNYLTKKRNVPSAPNATQVFPSTSFTDHSFVNPNDFLIRPGETLINAANRFGFFDLGGISSKNKTVKKNEHQKEPVTVKVKGEPEIISEELMSFIQKLEDINYKISKNDSKPYNLNIVGIRSANATPNSFDDEIRVFWKYENRWTLKKFKATTDPGLTYLQDPINDEGTAILKENQYLNTYRLGKHHGKYDALVQAKPVTVIRDFNRDSVLDYNSGVEQTGFFGINIHRASPTGESTLVNKWSAGCQVFANINEYNEFINLIKLSISNWSDLFTYSLVNSSILHKTI